MKKTTSQHLVIALGGNAITLPAEEGNIAQQFQHTRETMRIVADVMAAGHQVVLTHGNGPQVGNILRRSEIAAEHHVYPIQLELCVADTQGGMGYMIQQVLTSPVYAGVFVYGRRKTVVVPGTPPVIKAHRLLMEEWEIAIPDIYPTYISYDQYIKTRQVLRDNLYNFAFKGRGAAREGRGLLQGILICGKCGRRMTPSQSPAWMPPHPRVGVSGAG